ncbi:hypothetical protein K493DRAFT_313686 [Basidiobolus meristosporus CBS 931.73]|uniref:Uncharacterized protein n=1 Tax=Basidiobolus meristosporus CBS 931.73 TaxID=1314790 RepID=A0A1Y1X4V5_9FUNG|nr:hypothetical protein K493DRAFT_321292 [Basidiobolus meristosporus CBS 931.73]ORX78054.1 hypothetical protein K493DRAFT_321287 [Basidiobolus meristosporus CBS 931.73]ORX79904.1 hypothetical protein K493DRAFT_320977 [Basidiobolus meristosporus CBS 931.73]ORX80386.1 hypothetical protein K493DRAFT_320890 [Basidiobolus meristosporus CBS 931.73]ORX80706.1 hypothetical protein K493DRAFT_320837 [Basidiobolus meristosporus CBS 931.73]|eukprot:ORX78024.1 hypothetical protein K493DRAFT_321292 [Basidiobolus meristosporus CBS 931.73]
MVSDQEARLYSADVREEIARAKRANNGNYASVTVKGIRWTWRGPGTGELSFKQILEGRKGTACVDSQTWVIS